MPRPTSKLELIKASSEQFERMWQLIDSMTNDERNSVFNFGDTIVQKEAHWKRDKNIRDILVHLYEWHQLLLNWISSNQKGEAKPFLQEPYNWKTYGDMNVALWGKHQTTPYESAKNMLLRSHESVMVLIESFTDEELFERKHFNFTGTTTLGSYFVSVTSSHYSWAINKLKAHRKTYITEV